ncbi:extracellular solute-binding protein [Streptomyces sp. NPDC002446]
MPLSARTAAATTAVVLAALTATACAPAATDNRAKGDAKTGTLRVWLFREVDNAPKEKVVRQALSRFEAAHKGVRITVDYIPVDTRAQRIKAAFNDPAGAPDVIEYGNTDTAGYVHDGGLADVSEEFAAWPEAGDTDAAARASVTVDGRVYGAPLFAGVRALYYRTDVLKDLGIPVPATQAELTAAAKTIHQRRPGLYGLAVGGAYTYGALPFLWAAGGELATEKGGRYTAAVNSPRAKAGIAAYTGLFGDANCPAAACARMGGNDTVTAFAAGRAAMAIGGDFNHQAVENGKVKGRYAVVPLPGIRKGQIAPAFAGGNTIGVLRSSGHRTLAVALMKELAGKRTQRRLFDAMGFLPTYRDVRAEAARRKPRLAPFVRTLEAGARSVPADPGWGAVDASLVLPTMFQEIVSGRKDVDAAADDAARKMDEAFRR